MLPIPSFSQSQTAADGRMQFNNNARRAGFNPKDALRWQMSQQPQPQPMSAPMGIGMMSAGGPFAAAQRGLDRITAPHNFDTGPMSHPRGPAPVIGMTPRGMNAIGGATLEPNLAQNPGMSFGGTHDDGYRIGSGSGDGKFHDTFGTGIADIKKHGPGAGMGRGVAQQMSAPGMMGPPNPNDPYDPLWKQGYADGGMVTGPGGPKDDMVPAMIDGMKPAKLSSGEFVMPAEAVQFFGLDRLNKMKEKAKEGLMQMHAGEDADEHTEPHGMADMREDRAEGENDDPAGYAAGGFVNRFADDPMAAALREQEAKDARLAAIGGADLGGGNVAFRNRYGAGFATNPNGPMATPGGGVFNNSGDAMRVNPQGGLMPVPDVIPPGPWSNGARPFDSAADRANIDFTTKAMERDAPFMRQTDIALKAQRLATEPKGRGFITVPDATTKFPGSTGTLNDGHFLAPWEQDKLAADARTAADPLATLIPRATDRRRFMRTPQGIELAAQIKMQKDKPAANQAVPVMMPDGSVSKDHYMVNGVTLPYGQTRKTDPKMVDTLTRTIQDKGLDIAAREKARRDLSKHLGVDVPMPSFAEPQKRIHSTVRQDDGTVLRMYHDGTWDKVDPSKPPPSPSGAPASTKSKLAAGLAALKKP